jgi:hypothetical protein
MRQQRTRESFIAAYEAAQRILAHKGKELVDGPQIQFTEGEMTITRRGATLWITYHGREVLSVKFFDSVPHEDIFIPGPWMDTLERIDSAV